MGRKVMEASVKANGSVNVSGLAKGTYTLMVVGDNETYKAQFVK